MFGFFGTFVFGVVCMTIGMAGGYFVWRKNPTWVDEHIQEVKDLRASIEVLMDKIKDKLD